MPRIPYPDEQSLPDTVQDALNTMPVRLNITLMMSHATTALPPFTDLALAVLRDLELSPRQRELLILLVADHTDSVYERAQHLPIARAAGVTEQDLTLLRRTDTPPGGGWNEPDAALIEAGRELLDRTTLTDVTVDRLRRHFSPRKIVEAILVIGFYRMVAGLLNGLAVDIDPQGPALASWAVADTP